MNAIGFVTVYSCPGHRSAPYNLRAFVCISARDGPTVRAAVPKVVSVFLFSSRRVGPVVAARTLSRHCPCAAVSGGVCVCREITLQSSSVVCWLNYLRFVRTPPPQPRALSTTLSPPFVRSRLHSAVQSLSSAGVIISFAVRADVACGLRCCRLVDSGVWRTVSPRWCLCLLFVSWLRHLITRISHPTRRHLVPVCVQRSSSYPSRVAVSLRRLLGIPTVSSRVSCESFAGCLVAHLAVSPLFCATQPAAPLFSLCSMFQTRTGRCAVLCGCGARVVFGFALFFCGPLSLPRRGCSVLVECSWGSVANIASAI